MSYKREARLSLWSLQIASTVCQLRSIYYNVTLLQAHLTAYGREILPILKQPKAGSIWQWCWTYLADRSFSMQAHMRTSLMADALRMAWFRRKPAKSSGLIFRSDRGSQYCSEAYQAELTRFSIQSSMSRKGDCWELASRRHLHAVQSSHNAPTESLWGSSKVGRLYGRCFATRREAMDEVIDWLTFYNHSRLHSTLNYMGPMQFEARWLGLTT